MAPIAGADIDEIQCFTGSRQRIEQTPPTFRPSDRRRSNKDFTWTPRLDWMHDRSHAFVHVLPVSQPKGNGEVQRDRIWIRVPVAPHPFSPARLNTVPWNTAPPELRRRPGRRRPRLGRNAMAATARERKRFRHLGTPHRRRHMVPAGEAETRMPSPQSHAHRTRDGHLRAARSASAH